MLARLSAMPLALGVVAIVTGFESLGLGLMGLAWITAFSTAVWKGGWGVTSGAAH